MDLLDIFVGLGRWKHICDSFVQKCWIEYLRDMAVRIVTVTVLLAATVKLQ
jgi:hypothetical protein